MRMPFSISFFSPLFLSVFFPVLTMAHAQAPAEPPSADVKTVAGDGDAFAADLYARLSSADGNLFFSPYSISSALAMTSAGARGNTAVQMARTLHLALPPAQLHSAFADLTARLGAEAVGPDKKKLYDLVVASALWGLKGYPYEKSFLDLLAKDYGAGLREMDFSGAPDAARNEINAWVSTQTNDRIKDLLAPGTIHTHTRLVLTNAIYFKGTWLTPFEKAQTADAPFQVFAGKTELVPLMSQQHGFQYMETAEMQAVELPYAGNNLSMIVLLPRKADGLTALGKSLSRDNLDQWTGQLRRRDVQLFLPRFKLTSQFELADTLKAMGMVDAFSDNADFSGIAKSESLCIDKVIHKAFVEVNEEGTEAAAATAVLMKPTAVMIRPEPPVAFRADHSFVYLIRNRSTGAILFLGRLVDPKG